MYIDFNELSPNQIYITTTQTLIPRPIAWVLSENAQGRYNLAPFSYFNAVCSDPPLILVSVGKKPDGSFKDTRVNIEHRDDFVVHIAHQELMEPLNQSSATLPAEISEVDQLGLSTTEWPGSRLPRLTECRIAFACERYQIHEIGGTPQSLILGLVKGVYVDDAITSRDAKGRLKVHAERLNPIGRLGAGEFMIFGEVRRLARPA